MSGPRGDEFAPGSQYYVRPEGQVEDPFPAKLAEHFRQWAPPPNSAAGAEWGNWQPTPASAGERPAPLIRIGVVEGLDSGPPPPICLGGLGERHTVISDSKKAEEASRQMLLRILGSAGNVRAVICDTARTGAFRDFLEPGLCENIFPDDVDGVLKDLVQLQHKVATESEVQIGSAAEPWRILVITGNPRSATARDHLSLLTQSTNWGSIIALGTDIQDNELIQRGPPRGLKWRLDPQLPSSLVRQAVKDMAARAQPKSLSMIELIEASHQRMPSGKGLEGCVGTKRDGSIVRICFADETPHGLIVGRTGSGKTNFLTYMMSDLLHAYSPDDIQMYVVDGKKADLSVLGPGEGDETYFPQMRLLGSNVTDPEDGIAILRHIEKEMERRYLSMNDKRVKDIEGLRSRLPGEKWPRMLVVWDEVQELLDGPLSDAAVNIINKLARQGRQAGVHLMLGTQNWQGVEGIWKKPDMLKQFALRIALAGGEGMMDNQTNWSIMGEVTGHLAAINKKGGMRHTDADNEIVSTPEVTNHDFVAIKLRTFQRWSVNQPPEVLDGRIKPVLGTSQAFMELKPSAQKPAVGFVGQMPGIGGRAVE
ncbi:MAG TPA: FtsK/SpoIIIE domain-containing protein, partial [Candidatus Saccharimonadales bacterium]|nr:FtsK/SpoIIIE domain-containing protein [Candidatus Saccharimonadales bacterium]